MIRKICISLLMPGCMLYATEVQLTLPGSMDKVTYAGSVGPDFETYKGKNMGTIWFTSNNGGGLGNYDTINKEQGEGNWVNSSNVGTITMCGRSKASGDHLAMILGSEISVGSKVSSLTLSAGEINVPEGLTINSYQLKIAIFDGETEVGSVTGPSGTKSITLSPTDINNPFVWGENYKVIAIVQGGSNSTGDVTTPYTISNIQVKADITVPEPATATLSLMALAGLCVRRRRQRV